ncbi:MAG: Ig-like domain-containing protein [Verrucomicrobiae bacterium]|nr:Ig-like domain-containing protein [Verrucomicrobiae bacterium]
MAGPAAGGVLLNAEFSVTNAQSALYGWSAPFSVSVTNGRAILVEDGVHLPVRLQQQFDLTPNVTQLRLTFENWVLATNAVGQPPDTFQISLLRTNLTPLAAPTGQPESAAFFSYQQNGQVFFGPGVTVPGASTSGVVWMPQFPLTISVNLTNITSAIPSLLVLDLVGFDRPASRVVLRQVRVIGWEPLGGPDTATLEQDSAATLLLLTNDISRTGRPLVPASWRLETPPGNGTVQYNSQTGTALYQPAAGYAGSDSFTYTIADEAGHRSDPVLVTLTITPISQDPKDAWRRQFFAPADLANPAKEATVWGDQADPDGDGRNNLQEYVAGTVPTNGASKLEFIIERQAGGTRLRVTPRADGRMYTVLASSRPQGPYTPLVNPLVQINGNQLLITDRAGGAGPRFYRLQLMLWPSPEMLAWRQQYFSAADLGNPAKEATVWGDQADPDGDGRNNLQEYVAGTVPTNAASRLQFSIERGAGVVRLRITPRAEGRTYVALVSSSPLGPFTPLANPLTQISGNELIITDTAPGTGPRFYQVQVFLSPPAGLTTWRQQYFSAADLANPVKEATVWGDQADPDGDGRSNLQEYVAGTVPTNAASRLVFNVERAAGTVRLRISPRAEGRTYTLLVSSSLLGPYTPVANPQVQINGSELILTDPAPPSAGTRFYRLAISMP